MKLVPIALAIGVNTLAHLGGIRGKKKQQGKSSENGGEGFGKPKENPGGSLIFCLKHTAGKDGDQGGGNKRTGEKGEPIEKVNRGERNFPT